MDIVEHEGQAQLSVDSPIAESAVGPVAPEGAATSVDPRPAEPTDETLFTVLAGHARTRAPAHFWITGSIGVIDAVAVMIARPSLWWVTAAFIAASAYAAWGLADRALLDGRLRESLGHPGRRWSPLVLRGIRGLAVIGGMGALFAAVVGFVVTALGGPGALGW